MSFDFIKDRDKKIHFIGIGGISMSGLAEILIANGYTVSGSDMKSSNLTAKLTQMGATIYIGHDASNIKDADIVVYTAAISKDNPELMEAHNKNLILMDRAEFLGYLMKGHKYNVAVSGTHGKTTTTSMISHVILNAKLDPTILVGGELDAIKGNVRVGKSDYFITEACEYKESFLRFFPYIGIILNIEADHLDYYKDIDHIESAFYKFTNLIPNDGYLIGCADDERVEKLINSASCNVISYGINNGKLRAKNIEFDVKGCAHFNVYSDESLLTTLKLNVPGKHNVLNSLAAVAAGLSLNIDIKNIKEGIESFGGTHRRFEIKGCKNGVTVIDDYAHHPTEIKTTLESAKNFPHNKVYCVFQPHTYTRTSSLFNEFAESFFDVDKLILADIYAAREKDTGIVSSNMLGDAIREKGVNCVNLHSFDDIVDTLKKELKDGDILLTVGAGDVYLVGEQFLNQK